MRSSMIPLFALAMVAFLGTVQAAHAVEPAKFQIGKLTVWAIADAVSERDVSVFKEDPETLRRYVPSGKAPSSVMTFVVRAGDEVVLIDTGYGRDASLLLSGLAAVGLRQEDVSLVLITHMHGDHIGGLLWKDAKAFPKARVLIGEKEHAFWLSEKSRAEFPARESNFDMAKRVVDTYGDAVGVFAFGDSVAPGITALDAAGHTPGHTAFMIESEGDRLLCVADLLHAAALQFPRPDINATYDMNPEQARTAREGILKRAADKNLPIAGMHLPFPGIVRVQKATEGYAYQPGIK